MVKTFMLWNQRKLQGNIGVIMNRLHTYWLEINAVGFRNWLWFVVCLGRDEFHRSLQPTHWGNNRRYNKQTARRERAEMIDGVLMDLHRCLG